MSTKKFVAVLAAFLAALIPVIDSGWNIFDRIDGIVRQKPGESSTSYYPDSGAFFENYTSTSYYTSPGSTFENYTSAPSQKPPRKTQHK